MVHHLQFVVPIVTTDLSKMANFHLNHKLSKAVVEPVRKVVRIDLREPLGDLDLGFGKLAKRKELMLSGRDHRRN
jgi:hypothetical protein